MAAVRHLGCLGRIWTTHEVLYGLSITVLKFYNDRCSSFNNIEVSMSDAIDLKMPTYAAKIVFERSGLISDVHYQRNPKNEHSCMSRRRLSHQSRKSADRSDL